MAYTIRLIMHVRRPSIIIHQSQTPTDGWVRGTFFVIWRKCIPQQTRRRNVQTPPPTAQHNTFIYEQQNNKQRTYSCIYTWRTMHEWKQRKMRMTCKESWSMHCSGRKHKVRLVFIFIVQTVFTFRPEWSSTRRRRRRYTIGALDSDLKETEHNYLLQLLLYQVRGTLP